MRAPVFHGPHNDGALHVLEPPRTTHRPPPGANRHSRRRHGHDDPAPGALGSPVSRQPVRGLAFRPEGQQRPAEHHPAGDDRTAAPRLSERRRGHHRDQLLQQYRHRHGGLRYARSRTRDQRGRRPGGAPRGGRRRHPGAPALRGRRAGPHQPHGQHQPGRERPGLPQHRFRPAGGVLSRRHRRPGGRRHRPDSDRNHLRHPQRQGGGVRRGSVLLREGPGSAGDDFRHHHRRFRADADRPDHRGVL